MSIFSPTIFPDQVTVFYNSTGTLGAAQSSPFLPVINIPATGAAWGFAEYILADSAAASTNAQCLWTKPNQFASLIDFLQATAADTLSLNGSASNNAASSTTVTNTLTVSGTHVLVIVFITTSGINSSTGTVTLSDTNNLSWKLQRTQNIGNTAGAVWEFIAFTDSGGITSDVITATFSSATDAFMESFGVVSTTNIRGLGPVTAQGYTINEPVVAGTTTLLPSSSFANTTQQLLVFAYFGGSGTSTNFIAGTGNATGVLGVPLNISNLSNGQILTYSSSGYWYNGSAASSGVSSVSNTDGTLTISPTTGAVVASVSYPIKNTTAQTTLTGTTAGSVVWSQPEQGSAYKKFVGYASGYENTTTTAQTITFPTAFTNAPVISSNSTGMTLTASTTTLTLPASMTATATGWIIIEGY